jgi:phenylacetate-CoA ligase
MLLNGWYTFRSIRRALVASRCAPELLRQAQEQQLRDLLAHAYQHVPLYRALYKEYGFHPQEFRSMDDLNKVPVLEKGRLKAASPTEVVAAGTDLHRCARVETSGSTGTPLCMFLGSEDQLWQRSAAWRILFEHGFRWTDRTMEIRMTFGQRYLIQRLGIAPKEWVSILQPPEQWALRLVETRPEVIVAGAGTLQALAEAVGTLNLELPSPRLIISDSETLPPATRCFVRQVLGTDPIDVYGLVELSNFAWECEERSGFHVSADSHIVEIDSSMGAPGTLIATALGMRTMPIIRYNTGDLAEWETKPCACGRHLPLLRRIYGRAVDSVVLRDGSRLFWPVFHEIFGRYADLRQWRILQDKVQEIRVQVVTAHDTVTLVRRLEEDLAKTLPGDVRFRFEIVPRIPVAPGEKTRMIISKVNAPTQHVSETVVCHG